MNTIIGGTYRELCASPEWDQLFGSGLRAAWACVGMKPPVDIHLRTCISRNEQEELKCRTLMQGIHLQAEERPDSIEFHYEHPLAPPQTSPSILNIPRRPLSVPPADNALEFGMLEATTCINAEYAVYDPQSGDRAQLFSQSGSVVGHLAIVANHKETLALIKTLGQDLRALTDDAAQSLRHAEKAEVLIVKNGAFGASLYTSSGKTHIPCYKTKNVFSIGSGDVFSSVFWTLWALDRKDPQTAAETASKAVAYYCNTQDLPIPRDVLQQTQSFPKITPKSRIGRPRIYLAAPLFNVPERWFVEDAKRSLESLGLAVFSPFHEIGCRGGESEIASGDLAGLNKCDMVFALLDHLDAGTLFELGYATAQKKPIVAYCEHVATRDLTMVRGTGAQIYNDYATALYQTAWTALES